MGFLVKITFGSFLIINHIICLAKVDFGDIKSYSECILNLNQLKLKQLNTETTETIQISLLNLGRNRLILVFSLIQ